MRQLTTLFTCAFAGAIILACAGCGESDETKANIKAIAEAQKAQADAAAKAEAEKQRKIKEAHEFHLKQIEILKQHRSNPNENPFAPSDNQKPAEEKK